MGENEDSHKDCIENTLAEGRTIVNPYFFEDSISVERMSSLVTDLITELRCDVSLPEKKVEVFVSSISSLLAWTQTFSMSLIKSFLNAKQMSLDDNDTIQFLNALHIPNITVDAQTHDSNITLLGSRAKCAIPEPAEYVLGKQKVIHRVLLHPSRGRKFQKRIKRNQFSQKVKIKKEVFHYISVIDTLRLIMSNPDAREMVGNEMPRTDETIHTYKDGHQFYLHEYLQKYPHAVRLSFHIDEGEYADPLGSRKGNNKLTNICFKIQNMDARINASLDRVYVALMVKSSVLKKYGYTKVFQPLIEDLLKLETDEGVKINTESG